MALPDEVSRDVERETRIDMEQQATPPPTPRDATKVTADQRELQDQLEHDDGDPQAPARHQDRHQVADET